LQLEKGGFSIGAAKRRLTSSLIIGPGSGYNLVSNPLAEDNSKQAKGVINTDTKKRFSEQLRDEGESFRAVFDKRRQRVGVFGNGDGE
jgi:YLP motif-containing protein 1